MTYRINYYAVSPKLMTILLRQERCLQQQFSLSPTLTIAIWELVKLRVSQINQCAFCIDMHSKDALKQGELVAQKPNRVLYIGRNVLHQDCRDQTACTKVQ